MFAVLLSLVGASVSHRALYEQLTSVIAMVTELMTVTSVVLAVEILLKNVVVRQVSSLVIVLLQGLLAIHILVCLLVLLVIAKYAAVDVSLVLI